VITQDSKINILVVEDDQDIRDFIQEVLLEKSYGVTMAANGREALERLDETPFPIILVASQEQKLFSFAQVKPLAEVAIQYIKYVLNKCNGNKQKAASLLGINRKTIHRRLEV